MTDIEVNAKPENWEQHRTRKRGAALKLVSSTSHKTGLYVRLGNGVGRRRADAGMSETAAPVGGRRSAGHARKKGRTDRRGGNITYFDDQTF